MTLTGPTCVCEKPWPDSENHRVKCAKWITAPVVDVVEPSSRAHTPKIRERTARSLRRFRGEDCVQAPS